MGISDFYEPPLSNSCQDFLHKLSIKLVGENQTVVVESIHVKNMVYNSDI